MIWVSQLDRYFNDVVMNNAWNRKLLTILSVKTRFIENHLCGHMASLVSRTCIFIHLYIYYHIFWHQSFWHIFWHNSKTTVSHILSCKTLLHVFCQFIGKFHFWNVSLSTEIVKLWWSNRPCTKNGQICSQDTNYMATSIYIMAS